MSTYKYLGVVLDEHLSFTQCVNNLSDSACRALSGIIVKVKDNRDLGLKTFNKIYESGVQPIMNYGAGIWGNTRTKVFDNVQNRAMRFYLGVHKFAPHPAVIGDMGWLKPKFALKLCTIRLWNRLLKMSNNRLTKIIFDWDLQNARNNWSYDMHMLLKEIDMESCFINRGEISINDALSKFLLLNQSEWTHNLLSKPKLRVYRTFKSELRTENYIQAYLNKHERSIIAQFRAGILPLRIETGRYTNTKDETTGKFRKLNVNERICELCCLNEIEDELHFLLRCPIYNNFRKTLMETCVNIYPSFKLLNDSDKLIWIMKNSCDKNLAKYLIKSWDLRKSKRFK